MAVQPEQCSRSFPDAGLLHTTHTVGPKQAPVLNRCPFSGLSLASLSFPFPLVLLRVLDILLLRKLKVRMTLYFSDSTFVGMLYLSSSSSSILEGN